ncbi:lipase family alpha/beta hydrolase [Desulfosudis oleivorans]|uniref:Hydrolase of alpha/beta superfamily n=1 Tax=Desulfosudis oleivorans (strain DSM 6200 / JCM 39069 / Hxd3) TaxID=96561 RepID=A8ZT06_DESOH|nr:alpha/beta fold hydrolase [Desulfosudis oleivorans]ABW66170.1 hydrolase of alpha/beta superfamily [Desulfosudis oleivorans Hxd3]
MKKLVALLIVGLFVSISLTGLGLAGGTAPYKCDTRYPVVLAHGMGASTKILGIVDYWYGIEDALKAEGASVYFTSVNAMGSTVDKAADFKQQFMEILAVTGAPKANIIGHSHGTLYTRYAISNLGLAPYVASYTSLAGPHRGSAVASLIMYDLPDWLLAAGGDVLNFVYTFIFGDTNPDSLQNALDLCPDYMVNTFNPNTPNIPGIYYQSWAAKAKTSCPSVILEPTWLIMLIEEGANDGLVSVESAKWGNFRGVEDAAWYSAGCDHLNIVGQLFGVTPGFDAPQFFVDIVEDLKGRGY